MKNGRDEAFRRRKETLADKKKDRIYEDRDEWRKIVKCSPADR